MQQMQPAAQPPNSGRQGTTGVAKLINYAYWVWIIGSIVSLISAIIGVAIVGDMMVAGILGGLALVQTLIAIPAAIALKNRRANWARIVLIILAALSLAGLWQALQMHAWASVVLNLILGSTLGCLMDKNVRAACTAK